MKQILLVIPAIVYSITVATMISTIIIGRIDSSLINPLSNSSAKVAKKSKLKPISPKEAIIEINQIREQNHLSILEESSVLCPIEGEVEPDVVLKNCQNCTHAALIKIDARSSNENFLQAITDNQATATMINNPLNTHICTVADKDQLTIILAKISSPSAKIISPKSISTQKAPNNFSEEDLWEGLASYRESHRVKALQKDELLCKYARKRVADQINLFETTDKEEYPVPEKYPLDAHAGFINDADSSYSFDVTEKNVLAENLAYWPGVEYAHQVIEWGWDSSTEGHRETQLSNDYNKACISGQDGFYVAIFSN